jgi:hypothetical protein
MIAVMVSVAVFGCGGGDKSPREQCEDLLDVICGRATRCILGTAGQEGECFDALQRVAGCERVRQESPRYDACVSRVEAQRCADLFQGSTPTKLTVLLPVECNDVVDLMQASGADRAGADMAVSSALR